MKRSLILTILILILTTNTVMAQIPWDGGKVFFVEEDDYIWTIKFNKDVDETTVNPNTIYILDSDITKLNTLVEPDNSKTVKVKPIENYKPGVEYKLMITDGVKTPKGKSVNPPIFMNFTTSLDLTIKEAEKLYDSAKEGITSGFYKEGSKSTFIIAIDEAKEVLTSKPNDIEQLSAVRNLRKSIEEFQNNKILNSLEPVNSIDFDENAKLSWMDTRNNGKQLGYEINLYKNKEKIESVKVEKDIWNYELLETMRKHGVGEYKASVVVLGDGINYGNSKESAFSSTKTIAKLPIVKTNSWVEDTISWGSISGANKYEIKLYRDYTATGDIYTTTTNSHNFKEVFQQKGAGTYRIMVRALAKDNTLYLDGDYSDYSHSKIVQGKLNPPTGVILNDKGIVSWNSVSNATGYEIRLYKGETPIGSTAIVEKDIRNYNFLNIIKSHGLGSYTATVKALGEGNFSTSNESTKSPAVNSGKLQTPTVNSWSGSTANWSKISSATGYEIRLVKNGEDTGYMVNSNTNSYNFNTKIEEYKAGVYSIIVRALAGSDTIYVNSDYSTTSTEMTRQAKQTDVTVGADNKTIIIHFDDNVYNNTESLTGLKEKIMIAEGSTSFLALGTGDNVSIGGKQLTISLSDALTSNTNKVKILKDAIKDGSNKAIGTDIITGNFAVGDGSIPEITIVTTDEVTNAKGQTVTVKSNKIGRVYLILDTEATPNQAAMDIAVNENKGAYTAISKANTNYTVNVAGLKPGRYKAIAIDNNGVMSNATPVPTIEIKDGIPPVITVATQTVTNADGQKITAKINEAGNIYIIKSDAYTVTTSPVKNKPTLDEIGTAKTAKKAVKTKVSSDVIDKDIEISTKDLVPGTYHVFAVDESKNMSDKATNVITIRDGKKPVVEIEAQTAENNAEGKVNATSNKSGWIYIILDGIKINRPEDLEAATMQDPNTLLKKGAKVAVAEKVEGTISTHNLEPGTYYAYALDNAGNISERGTNAITIEDGTSPSVIAATQEVTNAAGQKVRVMSTEGTGYVYIVKDGEEDTSTEDKLEAAVANKEGAKAKVTKANANMEISTEGLAVGTYYAYAVDGKGNVSVKGSNEITVKDKNAE